MDLKLCRICCEKNGYFNIFNTDSSGIVISSKIMYCCSKVEISEDDGLPSYICNHCEQDLAIAFRFVSKCEATDRNLRCQSSDVNKNNSSPKLEVKSEEADFESNLSDNDPVNYNSPGELNVPLAICTKIELKSKKPNKKKKKVFNIKGPQSCSICGRTCSNPSTLASHMRTHTNEKPFQCKYCNNKYKDNNSLKRHSERNHSKVRERKFICEHCGKGFYSTSEIITHLRSHTGETPFACSECPSAYTQLSSLIRHKKKHLGLKTEICVLCTKRFCTKDQLKRHQLVHNGVKEFSCYICQRVFKYKHNLTKHHKIHSDPNGFICNHCGRTFNSKGNLKIHITRVHSEKSGYCKTCSKIVSNIQVHTWKHTGERPLKCQICTKSFYETKAYTQHMNFRHNHVDKFKCTVENCTRSFPSKAMLDYHVVKFHESRIVFPCPKCARGFYRKNDISRHMIGTHKEKLGLVVYTQ